MRTILFALTAAFMLVGCPKPTETPKPDPAKSGATTDPAKAATDAAAKAATEAKK